MIRASDTYLDVLLRAGFEVEPSQLKVSKEAISESLSKDAYFNPSDDCIHATPRDRDYANEVIRIDRARFGGTSIDVELACLEGHLDSASPAHPEVATAVEFVIAAQNLRQKELETFAAINSILEAKWLIKVMPHAEAADLLSQCVALSASSSGSFYQFYSYCLGKGLSHEAMLNAVEMRTREGFLHLIRDQAINSLGLSPLGDQESAFFEVACKHPGARVLLESLYVYVTSATERGQYNPIFRMPLSLIEDLSKAEQVRKGNTTFISQPLWDKKIISKKIPVPRILHVHHRPLNTPQFDETLSTILRQGELTFDAAVKTSAALEELP